MRRTILLVTIGLAFASCGDPTDRPEDCNPNEYFDEARKLCFSCRAVVQPRCDDGCGIVLTSDERGCPAAECVVGDDCTTCGPTEYIDSTLRCALCDGPMTCADDATPQRQLSEGRCTLSCP